jgi:hypothetical protein
MQAVVPTLWVEAIQQVSVISVLTVNAAHLSLGLGLLGPLQLRHPRLEAVAVGGEVIDVQANVKGPNVIGLKYAAILIGVVPIFIIALFPIRAPRLGPGGEAGGVYLIVSSITRIYHQFPEHTTNLSFDNIIYIAMPKCYLATT